MKLEEIVKKMNDGQVLRSPSLGEFLILPTAKEILKQAKTDDWEIIEIIEAANEQK